MVVGAPATDQAVVCSRRRSLVVKRQEVFNMSTADTMTPLVSAPWIGAHGKPLAVRTLPGRRPEVIQSLDCSFPGIISPALKALLATCCGLAETEIGSIDFTGCLYPELEHAARLGGLAPKVGSGTYVGAEISARQQNPSGVTVKPMIRSSPR